MKNSEILRNLENNLGKEVKISFNSGESLEGNLISCKHNPNTNSLEIKMSGRFVPELCFSRILSVESMYNHAK